MSIEKSHFFDQTGAILRSLWPVFEACGRESFGGKGKHSTFAIRQSAAFSGPLRSAGKVFV